MNKEQQAAAVSPLVVGVMLGALLPIAGCGPPTETFDPGKYPWGIGIRGDLEGFYRKFPEAAPDDYPMSP